MRHRIRRCCAIFLTCLFTLIAAAASMADELVVKSCSELMQIVANYQDDLKTIDTMLGSAIEVGSLDRIKIYKLKRTDVRRQLESILKAIDLKGCGKSR